MIFFFHLANILFIFSNYVFLCQFFFFFFFTLKQILIEVIHKIGQRFFFFTRKEGSMAKFVLRKFQ